MSEWKVIFDNTQKAIDAIDRATESALTAAAVKVDGDATERCVVGKVRGGNLRASINHEVDGNEARIGTNTHYAPWVEFGTDPHTITVKNAKVLTDGDKFFGKTVNHPGTPAQPFLRPALDENRDEIDRLMAEQYRRRLGELTR